MCMFMKRSVRLMDTPSLVPQASAQKLIIRLIFTFTMMGKGFTSTSCTVMPNPSTTSTILAIRRFMRMSLTITEQAIGTTAVLPHD